ncbi:MAG: 30S ribosome-binding factor RbfA [Pirellula sp.]|nr:30S ribosome-binding factor RbfA [Pirellula sp.]
MSTRRLLKAAEAIRGVVSMAILTELRDPRVQNVTVVGVEVTPDMREAKVLVSVMGNEAQQRTVLKGLQNSVGFLQSKIADRIETRYIPRLTFVMDEGVKKSVAVQQILEQISKERESNPTSLQIDPPVESSDGLDEQVESETSNDSGGNPQRAT